MFLKKFIPKFFLNYDKEYFFIRLGFLRIFITLMLLGGWIAAASASTKKTDINVNDTKPPKVAYLIFGILGFLTSFVIFVVNFWKILNLDTFAGIAWDIIFLVSDLVFLCAMFGSSIGCVVAESRTRSRNDEVNKGTFATAAIFGFLTCIAYLLLICIGIKQQVKRYRESKQTKSPS